LVKHRGEYRSCRTGLDALAGEQKGKLPQEFAGKKEIDFRRTGTASGE